MKRALGIPLAALSAVAIAFATLAPAETAHAAGSTANSVLASLTIAAPQQQASYQRDLFYTDWADADGDGYDTRAEVLMAASTAPVTFSANGHTVNTGAWLSWYDGASTTRASALQIDHLVPLGEAWQSGAWSWTSAQRNAYANDLSTGYSLQAVTGSVNESKGDKDPAHWMPPLASAACRYDQYWVLVKSKWNLTIDQAEHDAIARVFAQAGCGAKTLAVPRKAGTTPPTAGAQRLSGADRYATAVAVSQHSFGAGVPVAFVAFGENYPDALSAASAAAALGGPLLLTQKAVLPASVATELVRLRPKSIVVVGGTGAVSPAVAAKLKSYSPTVRRLSGADRYATSRAIAASSFATASTVFVATGRSFPDALSASAAAGGLKAPVVLVDGTKTTLDSASLAAVRAKHPARIVIAGGASAVGAGIAKSLGAIAPVSRFGGADRYATSDLVNRAFFTKSAKAYLASGTSFPDALAGAAVAGNAHAPLFIVQPGCVPDAAAADLTKQGVTTRLILGGTSALSGAVASGLKCSQVPKPSAPVKPSAPKPPAHATPSKPGNPGNSKNCGDFATHAAAQAWFNTYYPYYGDIAGLDSDHDGVACESLP